MRNRLDVEPVCPPTSLGSGPGVVTSAGVWVSVVTVKVPAYGISYLESLAYYAQSTATTIRFKPFINGVECTDPYYERRSSYGQIGQPFPVKRLEVPAGATFELRCLDTGATAPPIETDGEINTYAERIA